MRLHRLTEQPMAPTHCFTFFSRSLLAMVALAAIATMSLHAHAAEAQAPGATDSNLPVILLTGYEPFGAERHPNPSWEGVKKLDGRIWRGHRLATRKIKVVWGEPLLYLRKLIAELHPVAVFSFGQGGGFALETRARNARGPHEDNNGHRPPAPEIVPGGPAELKASLDAKLLVGLLEAKGYQIRLSSDAGAYLCEEMLYTLEWLKAEGEIAAAVGFCHVPPLGAHGPAGPVTAEHVQQFVEDYLDAWHTSTLQVRGQSPDQPATNPASASNAKEEEVREFIDRYFLTWSNQDMQRYGQCFMPQAAIQLIDPNGQLTTMPLAPFLRSQQESHRRAVNRMTETPESVEVRFDANLAHALVYWKLVDGDRTEYGYDHFTLMRSDGKWRIAHLLFYTTPGPQRRQ
jgi:pyroglutamyl-peptidase